MSEDKEQELGVPQGSVLSVSIEINDIVKSINSGTNCVLFVDDFLICYRPKQKKNEPHRRKFQICLDKLHK